MTKTTFDIENWKRICKALRHKAIMNCGGTETVYESIFTREIDREVALLPESQRTEAVIIAREKFGYLTSTEVDNLKQANLTEGFCTHGLDTNCCPLGCGDL